MAKPKTKEIPFNNTATEIQTNVWEWKTGHVTWRFAVGMGLNCGPVVDGQWRPQVYFPKLDAAAYFAEGFLAGVKSSDSK